MHQNDYGTMSMTKLLQEDVAKEASPAQTKLSELRSAQVYSHELFETLEAKLELILSPKSPNEGAEICPRSIPPSPICRELEDRCDSSHAMNRRIQSLIERLTI